MTDTRIRTIAATALATAALAATALVSTGPATAATPATAAACGNHAIAVSATRTEGATGHGSFVVVFRNASHSTCSLTGYPGLDAISRHGHVLAHAKRRLRGFAGGALSVRSIALHPGARASATVEWLNFTPHGHSCAYSYAVRATPPNTSHTVRLVRAVSICRLEVHPVVRGTSGRNWPSARSAAPRR